MFPETYYKMLQKLTLKTKQKKLNWYEVNHNGEFILHYGEFVFKIARMGDTLFSDYRIIIDNLRGNIDSFVVNKDEERFNEVGELYIVALRYARDVDQVAIEIEHNLDAI